MLRALFLIAALLSTQAFSDTINCEAKLFGRVVYIVEFNRQLTPSPSYLKVATPGGWAAEGIPTKSGRGNASYYLAIDDSAGFSFDIAEGDRDMAICSKSNECYRCQ